MTVVAPHDEDTFSFDEDVSPRPAAEVAADLRDVRLTTSPQPKRGRSDAKGRASWAIDVEAEPNAAANPQLVRGHQYARMLLERKATAAAATDHQQAARNFSNHSPRR